MGRHRINKGKERSRCRISKGGGSGKGAEFSPTLTLVEDNLDETPPTLVLTSNTSGVLTFDFDTSGVTDPGKGNGDIGTWTEDWSQNGDIESLDELMALTGTGYLWIRLTANSIDSAPVTTQEITIAAGEAVFEELATSGSNTAQTPQTVDNPAYASGNVIVVGYALDGNYAVQGPVYLYDAGGTTPTQDSEMSGINGETVTREEQSTDADQTAVTGGLFSYVATSSESAGSGLALALGAGDQTSHICAEFSDASGVADVVLGSGSGTTATSPATTATNAGGIVCCLIAIDSVALSSAASGWTILGQIDVGASSVALVRRDALTTASESVAAANHTLASAEEYVAITFVVEAA